MEYLLKASALIVLFYVSYKWFLQGETFFNSNRWFLFSGLIIGLFLPLLVIPVYMEVAPQNFTPIIISDGSFTEQQIPEGISLTEVLFSIYGAGVLFFFGKFTINMLSLFTLIKRTSPKRSNGIHYVTTEAALAPFSFFNWIVYNPDSFKHEELQLILNHERVHVKQWHSLDVIFSQLFCIIFWFNPIIWFYKKELQQNLEFIADHEAQSETDCKQSYQRLLLKASIPTHQLVMTNNFYNSLIKKRIIMLHKSKSNILNSWKYALVIPALALFLMSFNTETVYVAKTVSLNETLTKSFTVSANTSNSELKEIETYFSDKTAKIKFTAISRNSDQTIKEVTIRTHHDGDTKFIKRMTVEPDNSETIKPFSIRLSEDEKDILFQFSEKETTSVSKDYLTFGEKATRLKSKKVLGEDDGLGENPLYIINGKHYRQQDLNQRKYNISESIEVINKKDAIKTYGEAGKDGVIIFNGKTTFETKKPENNFIVVITKDLSDSDLNATKKRFLEENVTLNFDKIKRNSDGELIGIRIKYESKVSKGAHSVNGESAIEPIQLKLDVENFNFNVSNMQPISQDAKILILLNDKEISRKEMDAIDPSTIIKTDVIKDNDLLEKYGDKGKNGVILITTGNAQNKVMEIQENVLIFINGKASTKKDMEALAPNAIQDMHVLKYEAAKAKYGDKGKYGAIEITTKNKK
ncbi:M56 family metallopeptidase [Bizionia myxarmorum]|uniref:M56 family metallopeptidase n=1 Tax=Bizionia myxarmorum TaxID=291186 RepID=A0A5D0RES3_9FLAO|nr:M56 family metallopeptidase [Bizionia myxarmorum]TYB79519.1 M56 family metallopeptidase [Bizionia myxarmorum]